MNIETLRQLPKTKVDFKEIFQDAIIPEMNIYNQAYLEIERPLIEANSVHAQTSHELAITFEIEGQLKGKISCFLDTFEKDIKTKDANFFQLLFVESMNILVGRMLTQIESEHGIMAILSNPKLNPVKSEESIQFIQNNKSLKTFSVGYKLIALFNEFDCRMIFEIEK